MEEEIYTKKDVVASLEYGERMPMLGVVCGWMLVILGIFLGILPFCGALSLEADEVEDMMIAVFIALPFSIACGCYLLIWYYRWNRKVDLWLQDAVHLEAKCEEMSRSRIGRSGTGYKILVRFRYDGKRRTVYSGRRRKGKLMTEGGFGGIYYYYAGRVVDILYSPKYDQVMLLRLPERRKRRKNKKEKQKGEKKSKKQDNAS
ncbi:MAG: hypothetical protein J6D37_05395 [Clostridia bacterium]|nr:hypothetical protein [Clostridia bacterium]